MVEITGTKDSDVLTGSNGDDFIYGLGGNDLITGGWGADRIYGDGGNDTIRFTLALIATPTPVRVGLLDGGSGHDIIDAASTYPTNLAEVGSLQSEGWVLTVGNQQYQLRDIEEVWLGPGNDSILSATHGSIPIIVRAGDGDDNAVYRANGALYLENGSDRVYMAGSYYESYHGGGTVSGGEGVDTLELRPEFILDISASTAWMELAQFTITGFEIYIGRTSVYGGTSIFGSDAPETMIVGEESDYLHQGVHFEGRGGNDTLQGGRTQDVLDGGPGDDVLWGEEGDDIIDGGMGSDHIDGGRGDDRIVYDEADAAGAVRGGEGHDILIATNLPPPIEFDLLANGFERAELTYRDSGSETWADIMQVYALGWNLVQQRVSYDDGSRVWIDVDPLNQYNTSEVWTSYDQNSRLISIDQFFDDGTRIFINIDASANQNWRQIWMNYDSAGRLDGQDMLWDNGTRTFINVDQHHAQDWDQIWLNYDGQGRLDSQDMLFDDGTRTFINVDQDGSQAWDQLWITYDAQGRISSQDMLWDNGTRTFINLDEGDAEEWAQAWFTYDTRGRLDTQDVIFDDGSRVFYNHDQAGTELFAIRAIHRDTSGLAYQQVTTWDDGTTTYESL